MLTNVCLTTTYWPDVALESVRNTTLALFMGNVWCLMHTQVKKWNSNSIIKQELEVIRKSLKKLAIESCITILDVAMVKCIGVFSKNFALVQNRIG